MKKILYSLLIAAAALSAACDDDKDTAPRFELSTADWHFEKTPFMQRMIISAPDAWTITDIPDWCTVNPTEGFGPREIEIHTLQNEDTVRRATLLVTCLEETLRLNFTQDGFSELVNGFPVEWLFSAKNRGEYTDAFVEDNALPAHSAPYRAGTIGFMQDAANSAAITRSVGSTGHPYVTGALKNDYWLFSTTLRAPVPAGAVLRIQFITRSSATGARYWTLEYFDNGSWKTVGETRTAEVAGETVTYTHDLVEDLTGKKKLGTDNAEVDGQFPLSGALAVGEQVRVRFRCASDIGCNDTNPNTGTHRLAGAEGTSPVLRVQSLR